MSQGNSTDFGSSLDKFTIKVTSDGGIGTGVLVTNNGIVLTCFHVIGDSEKMYNSIKVHFNGNKSYTASLLQNGKVPDRNNLVYDKKNDIAFLKINDPTYFFEDGSAICPLSQSIITGNDFYAFGFRKDEFFGRSLGSLGKIIKDTTLKVKDIEIPVIQLLCGTIEEGMSGSPVFDVQSRTVIGIISTVYDDELDKDKNLVLAIPTKTIVNIYPEIKEMNPGLKQIVEFLEKIGVRQAMRYQRIDELYVAPNNYGEIEEVLQKDKVVFITGEQELGKTYTAVKLLWEYFKKGYEHVSWFKAGDRKEERSDVRIKLANAVDHVQSRDVMYFEDPFGKTEYEVNTDDKILRNVANIIASVQNIVKDAYVIVTSREEVFKEFQTKILAEIDLTKFEIRLSMKKPSYGEEERKAMLRNHATVLDCEWYKDETLSNAVFDTISKGKLPTPLNIEQFAVATATKEVLGRDKLLELMNIKSLETWKSFAEEIKNMSKDKIIFLTFPFISGHFPIRVAEPTYELLRDELDIGEHSWKFDRLLEWFKDDKIDLGYYGFQTGNTMSFSHPSYSEAMRVAIYDKYEGLTKVGEILCSTLNKLADDEQIGAAVTFIIVDNYDKFPDHIKNLISKQAASHKNAAALPSAILPDDSKLPKDVRNELIVSLADDEVAGVDIAERLAYNVQLLPMPESLGISILMKLADKKETAHVMENLIWNGLFVGLPIRIKELLLERIERNRRNNWTG